MLYFETKHMLSKIRGKQNQLSYEGGVDFGRVEGMGKWSRAETMENGRRFFHTIENSRN